MARWNRAYRGKEGPTDVLSFPCDGCRVAEPKSARKPEKRRATITAHRKPEARTYLGDIAIAPAVARRNALVSGARSKTKCVYSFSMACFT